MSADMSLPFISLMDTCTPLGIDIRTPFNINSGDAETQDGFSALRRDDNIVTSAMEGYGNASDCCFDLDMCTPRSRIHSRMNTTIMHFVLFAIF